MPSTTSSSLSSPEPSSTLITPSLPTFSMASATIWPITLSELAETVATCSISVRAVHGRAMLFSSAATASQAMSMPRLRSMGFRPPATCFMPSSTSAYASSVAVVVPSPATSDVLEAASRIICAPMFSSGSGSCTSLATTTPELMTVGAPNARCSMTVRAFGPRVPRTACASWVIPETMRARASSPNTSCLELMSGPQVAKDCFQSCGHAGAAPLTVIKRAPDIAASLGRPIPHREPR